MNAEAKPQAWALFSEGFRPYVYSAPGRPDVLVRIEKIECLGYALRRLKLYRGKGPHGFSKGILRDTAYVDIDTWNRRHGFPLLEFCPAHSLTTGSLLTPEEPMRPETGTLEEMYRSVQHCQELKDNRGAIQHLISNMVHSLYSDFDRKRLNIRYADIDELFLGHAYEPRAENAPYIQEIKRQITTELHRAVLVAFQHAQQTATENGIELVSLARAILEREEFLLSEALSVASHPNEWFGICEVFDTPVPFADFTAMFGRKQWDQTTEVERQLLVDQLREAAFDFSKPWITLDETPPNKPVGRKDRRGRTFPFLTWSQSRALDQLSSLANAYFSGLGQDLPLRPRYNALLVAATGSGKTMLSQRLADDVGAKLLVVSVGEWTVRGARNDPPTLTTILQTLEASPKVVLLLDEIDKFSLAPDSTWTRYCAAEIWALLDRRITPDSRSSQKSDLRDLLEMRLADGLFIVGAGTFEQIWDALKRPTCGFNNISDSQPPEALMMEAIRKQNIVSPELLSRFSPKPIFLQYPTRIETEELLDKLGLNTLAREAGVCLDAAAIQYTGVGMRALEQIGAELLIAKLAKQAAPPRRKAQSI